MLVTMLAKSLTLVLMATIATAEIPSYMKICGRKNPNLDKCVLESVEGLREKLRTGIPELDAPALEPLELAGFPLIDTDSLKTYATNVKMYGLSNFTVNSLHVGLKEQRLDIDTVFKRIIIDADYDVTAKIVVPITGKGPIHIVTDDVQATTVLKFKLIKKNDVEYMFFSTMTIKLLIKDYTADFKPTDDPESPIGKAITAAIEGGHQEILETIRPTLERVISEIVLDFSNKICKHFTFEELYPDRE